MIRFTSAYRFLFACIIAGLLLLPLLASAQEIPPCYELPECETPPPVSNQPSENINPPAAAWGGFSDKRLNPEMAEYYSIWCLDNVVRVLRGVPTTALIDDIPIEAVTGLPANGLLTRESGLSVMRNNDDMIAVSGNNGNNAPQEGLKVFSLAACLERNGLSMALSAATQLDETNIQTDSISAQQNALATDTGEPDFNSSTNNDIYSIVGAWIVALIEGGCSISIGSVLVLPVGWKLWSRRKRGKTDRQLSAKRYDQS
jgi:hypothetical protein